MPRILAGTALFLLEGLSLCLFYNYAFYGQVELPLSYPPALLIPLAYYLSMSHDMSAWGQALLWLGLSPLCCWLWVVALRQVARPSGEAPAAAAFLPSSVILIVPGLWLAYLHAWTPQGLSWQQFLRACLVRHFECQAPEGLVWLFHLLAFAALVWEARWLARGRGVGVAGFCMLKALAIALVVVCLAGQVGGWCMRRHLR